jgi:8-oxo-dGTP pyrophosphatase MutT (NUDIX family)
MISPADFFSDLRLQLQSALPGEMAQSRLSGVRRYSTSEFLIRNPGYRKSAVMILLWPENRIIHSLLIRRPVYEGVHSGQMAFPGGSYETGDPGLVDTAIRETKEEIGVEIIENQVAGILTPLYIPVSNFLVQPVVACLDRRPVFKADPEEVSEILDFELELILVPSAVKSKLRVLANGLKAETPYYDIRGSEVWGATAMILSELSVIVKNIISS